MSNLQQNLDNELKRQGYAWGHIVSERWDAVTTYAGKSVLDVGCSNGVYVQQLRERGHMVYGTDLLQSAQWSVLPSGFSVSDGRYLPFLSASFDTLISFETLEHIPEPYLALQEYRRVCRRNIIISVPNCEMIEVMIEAGLNFNHWIDRTHVNFFTMSSLQQLVSNNGFRVTFAKPILPVLHGLPFYMLWVYHFM